MTNQISAMILDSEKQSIDVLKSYLSELGYVNILGEFIDYIDGYNSVVEKKPEIVFVDISKKTDVAFDIIKKISSNQACKIVVTSSEYSADTVIKSMRAGAREFLPKPFLKDDLHAALDKIKDQSDNLNSENKKCRVISTFSNKGGIGKTSIAANLALELANVTKEKVALVDLNLQLGDVTTFLDIKPSFDISYVIQNLSKIDESFLLSTLEKYKDSNLYVLADPPYLEQAADITAEQITDLFNALKKTFSYIVVDTGASFDEKTIKVLDNADLILMVTIVNLPAIRNCQRCLDLFDRLGYNKEKVQVVLNRYMESDEISVEDVESVLSKKVYWKVPNNYFTIMSAINKGIPVSIVNPNSNIAQNYREFASMISDSIYKNDFSNKVSRGSILNLGNLIR